MRMKLIWLPCLVFFFGVLCASCGSDNNEPTDEPGTGDAGGTGDTEVKGDYIATTKVKTVVLKSGWDWMGTELPVCYEDFNRKWVTSYYVFYDTYHSEISYMEDIGRVNALSEVTTKLEVPKVSAFHFPAAQPKHGYAATFKTENDELRYLRLFVTEHTLSDDGAVATVTVQYQLY